MEAKWLMGGASPPDNFHVRRRRSGSLALGAVPLFAEADDGGGLAANEDITA